MVKRWLSAVMSPRSLELRAKKSRRQPSKKPSAEIAAKNRLASKSGEVPCDDQAKKHRRESCNGRGHVERGANDRRFDW
jgi:hypothetical protein